MNTINKQSADPAICDYSDYDYEAVYWRLHDRQYEDLCDRQSIARLLRELVLPAQIVVDAGCGYGRLFSAYSAYGNTFYLMDYAQNLLEKIAQRCDAGRLDFKPVHLIRGNLYHMPFQSSAVDLLVTVRTLHHITDPVRLFREINRIVKLHGYVILEIPNKSHLLNWFRWMLGKSSRPWSKKPLVHQSTFYNYHPAFINNLLINHGLFPICKINTSFFRLPWFKKRFSPFFLYRLERFIHPIINFFNLAPSIFVLCENRGIAT